MSAVSRAVSAMPPTPKSIVNYHSVNGCGRATGAAVPQCAITSVSGALTANTLATVFNITGSGFVNFLAVSCVNDGAVRSVRARLTLDGVVVFDSTSAAATGGGAMFVVGQSYYISGVGAFYGNDQIAFSKSFKFEIASNFTETGTITTQADYRTN